MVFRQGKVCSTSTSQRRSFFTQPSLFPCTSAAAFSGGGVSTMLISTKRNTSQRKKHKRATESSQARVSITIGNLRNTSTRQPSNKAKQQHHHQHQQYSTPNNNGKNNNSNSNNRNNKNGDDINNDNNTQPQTTAPVSPAKAASSRLPTFRSSVECILYSWRVSFQRRKIIQNNEKTKKKKATRKRNWPTKEGRGEG